MKKTLLFSSALLAAMAANAQTWEASAVAEGDFYLYNVGAGQFVQGGNSWGTQISLHQGGQLVTLEANGEGYNIDSHIANNANDHFFGGGEYLDGGSSVYTFEALEGGAYAIKAANGNYMYAEAGNSLVKHSADADLTSPYAQWKLLSVAALKADMANASLANPVDVTPLIYCAGFGRNNTFVNKWSDSPKVGGDNTNMNGEKWNANFDVNQVLEGMPAGNYKLMLQGFYRAGNSADLNEETASTLNAILYANSTEQPLLSIQSEAGKVPAGPDYTVGKLPNSQGDASAAFNAGLYEQTLKFKLVEAGDIKIGVKKEVLIGNDWSVFDNFRLIYTGVPNFDAVSALVEQAKTLTAKHDTELDEALGTAIQYAEQIVGEKDEDNMEKAVEELQAAMDAVNASIAQYEDVKAAIDAAKATAATFDEAGKAAFDKLIAWCDADYEAGEVNFNEAGGNGIYTQIQDALAAGAAAQTSRGADMTSLIVNADFGTGNLNGWTVENAQWQNNNTYGPINRFAEKWIQAPGTLADCSLTQTVTLGMGVYVLEADVVATQQGGMPEGGIVGMSLVAGDESVACSTGNGEATHYTLEFTAPYTSNSVELGFKVEGTNGNWWAVDNFKLTLKHIILPEPEMSELYFEEYDAMDNGICTYAKDMETNGTTYAQMQPITSEGMSSAWEMAVENGDSRAAGIFEYGSEAWLGAKGYLAPAEGTVEGSNHALGLNPVWTGDIQYTRPYALAKGFYKVKTAIYNAANGEAGGTDVAANKIGYITEDGTELFMTTKTFAKGEWTEDEVLIKIDEYCIGKLSAGVTATNVGTASSVHLFLDYLTVEEITAAEYYAVELPAAIAAAEAAKAGIEAMEGEGVFMYAVGSAAALDEAVATANALTDESTAEEYEAALAALKAVLTPAINKPIGLYTIKSANADVYVGIDRDAVKLAEEGARFQLVETETGYQLKSGDNYIGKSDANTWTLSTAKDDSWTIAYVGNGKYTLTGSVRMLGCDDLAVGSTCFGDKGPGNKKPGNYEWVLEKVGLTLESQYAPFLSSCVITVEPLFEGDELYYTIEGDAEEPEYQLYEGPVTVAYLEALAEVGACKYVVVVKEVDADGNEVAMGYDEISLVAPKPEVSIDTKYSDDCSQVTIYAHATTEGNMVVYSFSEDISEGAEGEIPADGYTLAWTPGMADESGACKWTIYFFEVDEEMNIVAQGFEEITLTEAVESLAGESDENPIELADGWTEEAIDAAKIGTDEAGYAHFTYTAAEDGVFVFSCGYEIKAWGEEGAALEAVESAAGVRHAYGKPVVAGEVVAFSAYLPQVFYGEQEKLDENGDPVLDENGEAVMEEVEVPVTSYNFYAGVDVEVAPLTAEFNESNTAATLYVNFERGEGNIVAYYFNDDLEEPAGTIAPDENSFQVAPISVTGGAALVVVTVREMSYDEATEEFTLVQEYQIELNFAAAVETLAGESNENPIVLVDGDSEMIAATEVGTDEAGYAHFTYTAAEAGTFVFSCGYEIKAFGAEDGMAAVESVIAPKWAYGKAVEAGETVTFSAYLPQVFYAEQQKLDENDEYMVDEEGNPVMEEVEVSIDSYIFTAGVEVASVPEYAHIAIEATMWHDWDGYGADANVKNENPDGMVVNLNTALGGGSVFAGPSAGVVPGNIYADLTGYIGIHIKGTPGTPWRGLFNRQSMEDAGDYINVIRNIGEDGELTIIFAEDEQLKDLAYIHLNSSKINWGAPDGAQITEFCVLADPVVEPLYTITGLTVGEYEDWGEPGFTQTAKVSVEAYTEDSFVIRAFDGTEGHDLTVVFDEDGNVVSVNGVTEGYTEWIGNFSFYVGEGYAYAYGDATEGYALLYCYIGEASGYYYIAWEDGADGIASAKAVKMENGAIYDLAGRKVSQAVKGGIYIINGKKVVVK